MATTRALMMDAADERTPAAATPEPAAGQAVPMCYYCSSIDTMEPFVRSDRVFLLSRLLPRVRARYCRNCTRHFLFLAPGHPRR